MNWQPLLDAGPVIYGHEDYQVSAETLGHCNADRFRNTRSALAYFKAPS